MAWPKYNKELENRILGEVPAFAAAMSPDSVGVYKKLNTPITSGENYRLALEHKVPCWIPPDQDLNKFYPRMIPDNVARGFVIDALPKSTLIRGGKDMFGVDWEYVPQVRGSMVRGGNPKVPDINNWEQYITFPDLSTWDWETCYEENKECLEDHTRLISMTIYTGFFERLVSWADMTNALLALIDEDQKSAVHRIFDRLADFYDEYIDYLHRYFHPDIICFHDDWGSQRAPLFSLETCMEMIVPYLKRVVNSIHKRGMVVDFHCCGKNEELVPAMLEAGVNNWNPQDMNDLDKILEMVDGKLCVGIPYPIVGPDTADEEIVRLGKEYVAKWLPKTKAFLGCNTQLFQTPPIMRLKEVIYEESRKALSE